MLEEPEWYTQASTPFSSFSPRADFCPSGSLALFRILVPIITDVSHRSFSAVMFRKPCPSREFLQQSSSLHSS